MSDKGEQDGAEGLPGEGGVQGSVDRREKSWLKTDLRDLITGTQGTEGTQVTTGRLTPAAGNTSGGEEGTSDRVGEGERTRKRAQRADEERVDEWTGPFRWRDEFCNSCTHQHSVYSCFYTTKVKDDSSRKRGMCQYYP